MNKNFVGISQKILFMLFSFMLLLVSTCSFALPFNIVVTPGTSLPTSVISGETASAYYTVTNGTLETRSGNYVKYLPPSVTQNTTSTPYGTTCSYYFNLAPNGQVGDSCILQLNVTGAVNASDPDQHHQLFVCFPGGLACAGTNQPLNVALLPPVLLSITITSSSNTSTYLHINQTAQLTATGNYSDGSTQNLSTSVTWSTSSPNVTISSSGLATGESLGTSTITATFSGVSSSVNFTVVSLAYISNTSLATNTIFLCNITNPPTNLLSDCTTQASSPTISSPYGIAINSTYTNAYVANSGGGSISACPLNANGTFGTCTNTTGFYTPNGIAISPLTGLAYITNLTNSTSGDGYVSICAITTSGNVGSCFTSSAPFIQPSGIVIDPTGSYAYITDEGGGSTVYGCTIDSTSNDLSCTAPVTTPGTATPLGVALNSAGTFLYVADKTAGGTGEIILCTVSGGTVGTCASAGATITNPTAIALNPADSFAYVTAGDDVYGCVVSPTAGTLSSCNPVGYSLGSPYGIAVN